jgi:NmrA-like family
VDADIKDHLESFVTAETWYDTAAHDRACTRVQAIVNATAAHPRLILDHSLLLLRAAERAGVKIFVADSWNYNWTKTPLGYHEPYDPLIMFKQQVELTSTIQPIYVFTGVLAPFWFNVPVKGWFQAENPGFSTKSASCVYFGDGKLRHQFTAFRDAAEYTVDLLLRPDSDKGGCFEVMSFAADVWEMKDAFERVTGREVTMQKAGSMEDIKNIALGGRATGKKNEFQKYMGQFTRHPWFLFP